MKMADHALPLKRPEYRAKHLRGSVDAAETQIYHLLRFKIVCFLELCHNNAIEPDNLISDIYSSAQYDL